MEPGEPPPTAGQMHAVLARLERVERENRELRDELRRQQGQNRPAPPPHPAPAIDLSGEDSPDLSLEDIAHYPEAAAAQRRLRRKALALLQYVCAKRPAEGAAAARRGALPALRAVLSEGSGYGSEARVAAGGADGWALVAADAPALAPALDALAAAHAALPREDREDEADEAEAIGRLRALLAARGPPPRAGAGAAFDHIEVDEWQDGGARHGGRSVPLAGAAQRGQQQQQQQQQQRHQRQQTVAAAAAKPALPLALAPPKP
ncbi:hypothetical protein Rsub_10268 [Raphidocelis subcapitata]|uniref:Uncharacterized protein n=1 Tax=Raphidocelis subcapitata TaxID=307507 RepID=A0A2V0PJF7_9CHLO|nr:hypothetical protein Rsub_10268 [Raphidocelis subcapitata]|eukprot:GBF98040.1 hypothetical protein Rsub_10268 [Raphidocelis subcapitata]